ncbi:Ni/Fe-hydrogenase cytochrome b subunit [Vibrio sp. MA40-2]|uniref:Ni/Fe-hydrogenase cytochrome b subunit n=1 Tax=Vibrio sp. MA40-2 TaxID=3391828 RepID=UPI0039A58994
MAHIKSKALGGTLFSWRVIAFSTLVVISMILIVYRLFYGIGSISNLNAGYAWGLLKSFNLLVGTGLASGGWVLAWAVYFFNKGDYHPLVRPALLASLFGYALGGLSITIDLGRYFAIPYFFVPGQFNINSVLFETAVCMTIYIGVLFIEFAPSIFEKFGAKATLKKLNKVMYIAIALGLLLPMMHQSSMGSLFILSGHKIHPLWQSYEMLPIFSLFTAAIMGFSIVVYQGALTQAGLRNESVADETHLFYRLTQVAHLFLIGFVVLRFAELVFTDKVNYLANFDFYALMFWIEMGLFCFPLVIFHWDALRKDSRMLFIGALSMMLAASMWRMNLSTIGYMPGDGYHYFPSTLELIISVGLIAVEVATYLIIIRFLPVMPALERVHSQSKTQGPSAIDNTDNSNNYNHSHNSNNDTKGGDA